MEYKEYTMSDDELVMHLVSSITRNPRRDMSIAIDEILRRMKAAQQAAQQADGATPRAYCKVHETYYDVSMGCPACPPRR